MKTIKERAQSYTDKVGILGAYQGYIAGATEQKKIDEEENGKALLYCTDKTATRVAKELIEKFKDWLFDNAPHSVWEEFVDTHAFEGISGNKEDIPSNLTWQDIRGILNAEADLALDVRTERAAPKSEKEYCQEVLKRFNEQNK